MITFTVRGTPAPQGSKSYLGASTGGKPMFRESSRRIPAWRADVRAAGEGACQGDGGTYPDAGPVAVELAFRWPRPKGHYGSGRNAEVLRGAAPLLPAGVPDLDKLARAVLDALTGVVWDDDAQVVDLRLSKRYADMAAPGVDVRVRRA
jgi:Holliday junction resolvase RusA-like endonuclease